MEGGFSASNATLQTSGKSHPRRSGISHRGALAPGRGFAGQSAGGFMSIPNLRKYVVENRSKKGLALSVLPGSPPFLGGSVLGGSVLGGSVLPPFVQPVEASQALCCASTRCRRHCTVRASTGQSSRGRCLAGQVRLASLAAHSGVWASPRKLLTPRNRWNAGSGCRPTNWPATRRRPRPPRKPALGKLSRTKLFARKYWA